MRSASHTSASNATHISCAYTLAVHRCNVKNVPRLMFLSEAFETPLNVFQKLEREVGKVVR